MAAANSYCGFVDWSRQTVDQLRVMCGTQHLFLNSPKLCDALALTALHLRYQHTDTDLRDL